MRYLRSLADRDFGLDRGMIPLGSCTMKLNPAASMEPISYPGFANLHPFVPASDAVGYAQLIDDLERWLSAVTGYDRVSLQPVSYTHLLQPSRPDARAAAACRALR